MNSQIVSNVLSSYIGRGIGLLLGIVLVPFLIAKLGPSAFGVTVLAESIIAIVEVANASVRTALARHLTIALARGDEKEFTGYLSTGRYLLIFSSILVLSAAILLTLFMPRVFSIPPGLRVQSQILFFFMSLAFVATIPNAVYWAILYAKQRFDLINFSTSVGVILRAAFLLAAFLILPRRYATLATYGLIYLTMTLLQNYFIYYWHKKVMPGLRVKWQWVNKARAKEIFSFSVFASIYNLNSVLYDSAIQILINRIFGPTANAIFAVSLKFSIALKRVFQQTAWTLTPTFTDYVGRNDKVRLERLLFASMKLTVFISMPICVLLIVFSREVILWWVGRHFLIAATIMPIHLVALVFTLPLYSNGCLMNAYAKLKIPCLMSLVATAALVVIGIVLIKVFHFGLLSMAIADAAVTVLYMVFFSMRYIRKISGVSMRGYLFDSYLKPIFLTGAYWWAACSLVKIQFLQGAFFTASATLIFFAVSYVFLSFFLIMDKEEKEMILKSLSRLKHLPVDLQKQRC